MNELNIPNHVIASAETTSVFKLSRKFPAKFSYATKKNGWINYYYSDSPGCVAISELWLKKITEVYDDVSECWSLITPYHDGTVFFMLVRDGVVRESVVIPVGDLDEVDLACSETIFMTEPNEIVVTYAEVRKRLCEIGIDEKVCTVHPLHDYECQGFELNPKRSYKVAAVLSGMAVLFIAVFLLWSPAEKETQQTQVNQVVDEFLGYRAEMNATLSAHESISSAFKMAAYGALLPKGWSLNGIALNGRQITATVMRDKDGLYSVAQAWFEKHSTLKPFIDFYPDRFLITQDINATLNDWENKITAYQTAQKLIDKLVSQQWIVDSFKESKSAAFTALSMTVKKDEVYVNELQSLAAAFSVLAIGIDSISIVPDGVATYRVEMKLKYIGENQ